MILYKKIGKLQFRYRLRHRLITTFTLYKSFIRIKQAYSEMGIT